MQTEQPQLNRDMLSILSRPFSLELPITISECIDQLEAGTMIQPIGKPKKSLLKISPLEDESYLFSFESLGVLGSLLFRGRIESTDANNAIIKGFVRLSDTALLKNVGMIFITVIFIKLPYISIAFILITISSIYFDLRLLRNASQELEMLFKSS